MTRIKLDLEPDPEVSVIGISSHEKDYRLCWALNRRLGIAMGRRENDITDDRAGTPSSYAVFDHEEEGTEAHYMLVNNHGLAGSLFKEFRQADYFLVVDNNANIRRDELLDRVRTTEHVLAAFPLEFKEIRGAHKLLR